MNLLKKCTGILLITVSIVLAIIFTKQTQTQEHIALKEISISQVTHLKKKKYSVLFASKYCGKCTIIKKRIQDTKMTQNVFLVDIDSGSVKKSELKKYNVYSVPTIITIKNGKMISHNRGLLNTHQLIKIME